MNGSIQFEPQVLQSISRFRNELRIHRQLYRLSFILPAAIPIGLVAVYFLYQIGRSETTRHALTNSLIFALAWLPVLFIWFLIILVINRGRGNTILLSSKPEKFDRASSRKFGNALGALCIGTGLPELDLVILDSSMPNSISYLRNGEPAIGITTGLLESGLGLHEVEAILAHELSRIMIGDVYDPSRTLEWSQKKHSTSEVTSTVEAFVCFTFLFVTRSMSITVVLLVVLIALFLLALAGATRVINRSRMATLDKGDLLADSIAVKTTYNPGALKSAVFKVSEAIIGIDYMSGATLRFKGSRYFFIMPQCWMHSGEMLDATAAVERRLENLNAIEEGRWPALEERVRG